VGNELLHPLCFLKAYEFTKRDDSDDRLEEEEEE